MKRLIFAALLCLSPMMAHGQPLAGIALSGDKEYLIESEGVRVVGDRVYVKTQELEAVPLFRVVVTLPDNLPREARIKWKCSDISRLPVPFEIEGRTAINITQPGRVWVECDIAHVDFEAKTYIDEEVEAAFDFVPDPKPDDPDDPDDPVDPDDPPDDPDPPTIPNDQFNNLGARVYEWAKGLPQNKLVANAYQTSGESLLTDPQATQNSVNAFLIIQMKSFPEYTELRAKLNAELEKWKQAGPMTNQQKANFYIAIANGLKA